jgi:rare lipoprotein A
MLRAAKILQQVPIEALSTGWRFSMLTTILLIFATLIITPSNSPGGSADTDGVPPKNHHRQPSAILTGKASYYPSGLSGRKTASGEKYRSTGHTAASNRLPLGTDVKVINLKTGKSTQVKINDRGPALGNHRIDLSKEAAKQIGLTRREGTAPVEIKIIRKPPNHNSGVSPSSMSNSMEPRSSMVQ